VADDLLILCPDAEEAHKVRKARLRPAAMPLKGTLQTANRDLASGESASWLGYDLCRGEQGGQARLHDDAPAWDRLRDHLLDTHERPDAPLAAIATIESWVGALGPCYPHAELGRTYARVRQTAHELAFQEIPTPEQPGSAWAQAHERWKRIRGAAAGGRQGEESDGGSASPHRKTRSSEPGTQGLPGQAIPPWKDEPQG